MVGEGIVEKFCHWVEGLFGLNQRVRLRCPKDSFGEERKTAKSCGYDRDFIRNSQDAACVSKA
jgi:hypothetical protein